MKVATHMHAEYKLQAGMGAAIVKSNIIFTDCAFARNSMTTINCLNF